MSASMWAALGAMPVPLRLTTRGWVKPIGAPTKFALDALKARGLVVYVEDTHRWERTPAGEAVWGAQSASRGAA